MFKMRCGIPNAYILDKTMYKMLVLLCSYCTIRIYICVKHFGMANIKLMASQAKTTNLYKNTRFKLLKCCTNICFNKYPDLQ